MQNAELMYRPPKRGYIKLTDALDELYKRGKWVVVPTEKKTYQGDSKNTKWCQRGRRPRKKARRGQGR